MYGKRLFAVIITMGAALSIILALPMTGWAHCEVPCGIFGDDLRFSLMMEDADTIGKCMKQIVELQKAEPTNMNQLVRWINTKEDHARKIQDTATQYFMFQRVKLDEGKDQKATALYHNQLTALHKIVVIAMKTKQQTDNSLVEGLKKAIHEFQHLYQGQKKGQ